MRPSAARGPFLTWDLALPPLKPTTSQQPERLWGNGDLLIASGAIVDTPKLRTRATHICALFRNQDEEYEILTPFIQQGLARGEKAFHVVDPKLRRDHLHRLEQAGIEVKIAEARRQLEVRDWQEFQLRNGRFDQQDTLALIEDVLKKARAQGFRATRFIAHMEWILEDRPGLENFLEFEARLNYVLPKYRDPVFCVYNGAKFDAEIVMDILRTHPVVMISGVLHQNPFFIPPDEFLREMRDRGRSARLLEAGITAEGRRLRRAIRELVALSVLPATWIGREPEQIVDQMLSILVNYLQIEAAYIRLRRGDGPLVERSNADRWPQLQDWLKKIDAAGASSDGINSPQNGELQAGNDTLHLLYIPIGIESQAGCIVVGALRAGFPDEMEMLVLSVAANQALNAFQSARLLYDRERVAAELDVLKDDLGRSATHEELIGTSPAIRKVISSIAKVARTDSTVLITGETGTGKELVARAIHERSRRASRPFVSVNCAALPASLIASELFGHEKGAFTGAQARRLGRFELAHEGTLFLDEVGELSMEMQVALLRVLQERAFERIGGTEQIKVDVRVLAATNRDLREGIAGGIFRLDLYYRLNVFPISMPPLRDRKEDISALTRHFIVRYAAALGKTIRHVDARTMEMLQAYDWPGNIRELQNIVERSLILCERDTFTVDPAWLTVGSERRQRGVLLEEINAYERKLIEDALRESRGKVAGRGGAASRLGIPSTTLASKIKGLGIDVNRFR